MQFISKITYVNGMPWGFFEQFKRAVVFIDYEQLKIMVNDGIFVYQKGEFFTSYNYKTNLIVINGEGKFIQGQKKTVVKNIKFRMPSRPILDEFTEEFKRITLIQEFGG